MKKIAIKTISILLIGGTITYLILPKVIMEGFILVILSFCIIGAALGIIAYNKQKIQEGNKNVLDAINGAFNVDLQKAIDDAKERIEKSRKYQVKNNK